MILLSLCCCGHDELTKFEMSEKLNLSVSSVEARESEKKKRQRERDKDRLCSPEGARRRKNAKYMKGMKQQKEDPKLKHASGKVALTESARTASAAAKKKTKKSPKPCESCGYPGHTKSSCTLPPANKYGEGLGHVAKVHRPELLDW
jgi:hypothetical protein